MSIKGLYLVAFAWTLVLIGVELMVAYGLAPVARLGESSAAARLRKKLSVVGRVEA